MSGSVDLEVMQHLMTRCITHSDNPFDTMDSFQKTLNESKNVIGSQHKTLQVLKQGRICAMCDCIITENDEYIIDGTDYVCIDCAGRSGMVVE